MNSIKIVYDNPTLYDFVDISQNNHNTGQTHWDNLQWVRQRVSDKPRPLNTVKIYGADTGRYGSTRDGVERFWRNLFGGVAATRFHRPDSGIGLSDTAKSQIRSARLLLEEIDIFHCSPDTNSDLLGDREPNEAYLTYEKGRQYVIYFPDNGEITVNLSDISSACTLRWLSLAESKWLDSPKDEAFEPQGEQSISTPESGGWVAVIKRTD